MNKIDQSLIFQEGVALSLAIAAPAVLDLKVKGRDRNGHMSAVLWLDLAMDDGTDDASVITCKVYSDELADPTTEVLTVFNGTLAQYKARTLEFNDRIRAGLYGVLGSKAKMVVTSSVASPIEFMTYIEVND